MSARHWRFLGSPWWWVLFVFVGLTALSAVWVSGEREVWISPSSVTDVEGHAYRFMLPRMVRLEPVEPRLLEDGRALGPLVSSIKPVREVGGGRYREMRLPGLGLAPRHLLFFSSSDHSDPRRSSRRYMVTLPRGSLLDSWLTLFIIWTVVGVASWRAMWPESSQPAQAQDRRALLWTSGQAAAALGLLIYTLFAFQAASLTHAFAQPWLVGVAICLLIGACGNRPLRAPGEVGSCIFAIGLWATSTVAISLGGRGDPQTLRNGLAVCGLGLLLSCGLRGILAESPELPRRIATALTGLLGLLLILQGLGLDLGAWLGSSGNALHARTAWTDKFAAHWLVALGWVSVALSKAPETGRRLGILAGVGFALWCSGSKTGLFAWGVSVLVGLVALRFPDGTRKSVLAVALLAVLSAPWSSRVPWHLLEGGSMSPDSTFAKVFELPERGSIWEVGSRIIALRPTLGWGFGASSNLCQGAVGMAELLAPSDETLSRSIGDREALPGGHPHNAALQTWLDLGAVGALLFSGLLWAIERVIARTRALTVVHGGLLGLLTANLAIFSYNYPLWSPTVLSVLWMSALVPIATISFPPKVSRLFCRAPLVFALLAALGYAGIFAARWLELREIRSESYTLTDDGSVLLSSDESVRLEMDPGLRVTGARLVQADTGLRLRGRAIRPRGAPYSSNLLVFLDESLVGVVWPSATASSATGDPARDLIPGFDFPLSLTLHETSLVTLVDPENGSRAESHPLSSLPVGDGCPESLEARP